MIDNLQRKEPILRPLMNEMEIKATGMLKSGGATGPPGTVKSQKPLTEFQPFNLTTVKPRQGKLNTFSRGCICCVFFWVKFFTTLGG